MALDKGACTDGHRRYIRCKSQQAGLWPGLPTLPAEVSGKVRRCLLHFLTSSWMRKASSGLPQLWPLEGDGHRHKWQNQPRSGEGQLLQQITPLVHIPCIAVRLSFCQPVNCKQNWHPWREAHSWHYWSMLLVCIKCVRHGAWAYLLTLCHHGLLALSEGLVVCHLPYIVDSSWGFLFFFIKTCPFEVRGSVLYPLVPRRL